MRLDEVKDHFGDQVSISWKSFLLKPESKNPDREKFIRYTQGWERIAALEPKTSFVPWATSSNPPTGSLSAQVAQKIISAEAPEYADAMHHKLLEAYFKKNLDISDWSVLAHIANELGVGETKFISLVDTHRLEFSKKVIDEHNEAINQGITSVPTVLINHVLPVPGAQETETYINWISRLIERKNQN